MLISVIDGETFPDSEGNKCLDLVHMQGPADSVKSSRPARDLSQTHFPAKTGCPQNQFLTFKSWDCGRGKIRLEKVPWQYFEGKIIAQALSFPSTRMWCNESLELSLDNEWNPHKKKRFSRSVIVKKITKPDKPSQENPDVVRFRLIRKMYCSNICLRRQWKNYL